MKKIENLKWKPHWTSHIGCLIGCKEFLGVDVSDAAVFGATGHAFIINMHAECCLSGPTAWKTEMIFNLGKNIGLDSEMVFAEKHQPDFAGQQRKAFEFVQQNIDAGVPCYGWELKIPEYYVVNGYDDNGYYYSGPGCDHGKGFAAWEKLGNTKIGILEMYNVRAGEVKAPEAVLHEAFDAALKHAGNTENWTFPNHRSGLAGYAWWIAALEEGKAGQMRHSYNAAVWHECRTYAVQFLEEYQEKVSGNKHKSLVSEALSHYRVIADQLKIVTELHPFNHNFEEGPYPVDERLAKSVAALKLAKDAEAQALAVLEKFVGKEYTP